MPRDEAIRRTALAGREHPPEEIDLAGFDYTVEDGTLAKLE
jgi:hypothetical protein